MRSKLKIWQVKVRICEETWGISINFVMENTCSIFIFFKKLEFTNTTVLERV